MPAASSRPLVFEAVVPEPAPQDRFSNDRVLVVFDVNIYLDVARLLGEPFTWQKFDDALQSIENVPVPHPTDPRYDSLRAIATTFGGKYVNGRRLEVWTSDHIDVGVALKSSQPIDAADERDRGLGWSPQGAQALVSILVGALVLDETDGDSIGEVRVAEGTPPLDYEDGCVFATVREAGREGIQYDRFCVTRDNGFRTAKLPGLIEVLHPADWVAQTRRESRNMALSRMPRPVAGQA